jgi:hypothetical protein
MNSALPESWVEFSGRTTYWTVDLPAQTIAGTLYGDFTVTGFTSFGTGNTGLQSKILAGTTSGSQGGSTSIVHGLTGDKIASISVKVNNASNSGILPGNSSAPGYLFYVAHDATNILVANDSSSSSNILNKPITILIWYVA